MSQNVPTNDRGDPSRVSTAALRPRLRVQTIEKTAIFRFVDAEILLDEEAIRAVVDQLDRLVVNEGHTRLLLNFAGVRYLSGSMLGRLAGLHRKVRPPRGSVQLCRLDPLVRDLLRISGLDRVLDVRTDEADALGLMLP